MTSSSMQQTDPTITVMEVKTTDKIFLPLLLILLNFTKEIAWCYYSNGDQKFSTNSCVEPVNYLAIIRLICHQTDDRNQHYNLRVLCIYMIMEQKLSEQHNNSEM